MTTTHHHLNETPLERELRFLDRHIERLEGLKQKYEYLDNELLDWVCEDRRRQIYAEQADLEVELVLLEACYDRKAKLEGQL